jgi:hypothetical protein
VRKDICKMLVAKPEAKGPLRQGLEDNIKMGIGLNNVDWICLARDRDLKTAVVNTVMNLMVQ